MMIKYTYNVKKNQATTEKQNNKSNNCIRNNKITNSCTLSHRGSCCCHTLSLVIKQNQRHFDEFYIKLKINL